MAHPNGPSAFCDGGYNLCTRTKTGVEYNRNVDDLKHAFFVTDYIKSYAERNELLGQTGTRLKQASVTLARVEEYCY